jgi:hypothetical protein
VDGAVGVLEGVVLGMKLLALLATLGEFGVEDLMFEAEMRLPNHTTLITS